MKLEGERRALAAFVQKFDALGSGGLVLQTNLTSGSSGAAPKPPLPVPGGASAIFAERQRHRKGGILDVVETDENSPFKVERVKIESQPSLLEEQWDGVGDELSFEQEPMGLGKKASGAKRSESPMKEILIGKENLPA
jgi:centromeric protein E